MIFTAFSGTYRSLSLVKCHNSPSGHSGLLSQIGNLIVCTKGNGDLAIKIREGLTSFGGLKMRFGSSQAKPGQPRIYRKSPSNESRHHAAWLDISLYTWRLWMSYCFWGCETTLQNKAISKNCTFQTHPRFCKFCQPWTVVNVASWSKTCLETWGSSLAPYYEGFFCTPSSKSLLSRHQLVVLHHLWTLFLKKNDGRNLMKAQGCFPKSFWPLWVHFSF